MKKTFIIITVLITEFCAVNAQEQGNDLNTGVGFGFQLNQYQKDFGFGLNFTSPCFVYERFAIRLRGNLVYYESAKNANTTWIPYSNVSVGLIGIGGKASDHIRLYGEGGFIWLIPSQEFTSENLVSGGYGLFGFEFFIKKFGNYFIEIGGVGTGAQADKIENNPVYSNGLLISAGFRIYLK